MRVPALKCPRCKKLFGLLMGTTVNSLESLSDPFDAMWVHYATISQYHKVAVRRVTVDEVEMIRSDD